MNILILNNDCFSGRLYGVHKIPHTFSSYYSFLYIKIEFELCTDRGKNPCSNRSLDWVKQPVTHDAGFIHKNVTIWGLCENVSVNIIPTFVINKYT